MKKKTAHKPVGRTLWIPWTMILLAIGIGFVSCLVLVREIGMLVHEEETRSKFSSSMYESLSDKPVIMTPTPTLTPTPTPPPYPPAGYHCHDVPILMYHHIQDMAEAQRLGHGSLTVDRNVFASQMEYLRAKGYTVITLSNLSAVFDGHSSLPPKPVILTVDDGYEDFSTVALPILVQYGYRADLFVPTGLMDNPGYLTWDQVRDAASKGIAIGHHSWSHAHIARSDDAFFARELDVPIASLMERGYGPVNVFAYPYGTTNARAVRELAKRGISIAVTTAPGRIQCKEDRLLLRRIRVGNRGLASYGL